MSFGTSDLLAIWYILEWIIRIFAIFIVPQNRKPTSGISWLMLIFLLPVPGLLLFLLLSSPKLPLLRRKSQDVLNQYVRRALKTAKLNHPDMVQMVDAKVDPEYQITADLAKTLTGLTVVSDTSAEFLSDYLGIIDRIVKDIRKAKNFVYVEFFIIALDDTTEPIFDAMKQATERGVIVRVLFDYWGSFKMPGYRKMVRRLKHDGISYQAMLPLRLPGMGYVRPDLRNHRKLMVVDNELGYTGSLNLVERAYHRKDAIVYDELMVRVKGITVLQLKSVFLADWYSETGILLNDDRSELVEAYDKDIGSLKAQVVPSGPGYEFENNLKVLIQLFHSAKKSITIVNPYFVPDDSLAMAIVTAAQRGVEVTLVNSEAIDQVFVAHAQSSYYQQMLEAGVHIYHYKAPTLLHSKYFIVDDVAVVGSSNADIRSFQLNHELVIIFYDKSVALKLRKLTGQYLLKSKHLTIEKWRRRSTKDRLIDNIARLTSALQ